MTNTPNAEWSRLRGNYRVGYGLERKYYTSPDIYEHDLQHYWNEQWLWAGHTCEIPDNGDFILFDYGKESIIIARDKDGVVAAFLNVCRHRGSRVCVERSGNRRVFSCPYHAWTYEMNGKLRRTREMGEGFDPTEHGLLPVHLRIFEGLIFISTAKTPPDIDRGLEALKPLVKPYGLENLKIAKKASYPISANWKLAIENYMECYHCGPAHLEFSRSHSLKDPDEVTKKLKAKMHSRAADAGLVTEDMVLNTDDGMGFYYRRYPLFDGYKTGSKSGEPLASLLGELKSFDGGTTDLQVGIVNNFLLYSDHVVAYRFIPAGLQETNIEVIWFVRNDAEEGMDYNVDDLSWLWHVTSLDDERIIRVNQEGVNSYHFQPGPLSEMEWGIRAFYDSYLGRPSETNGGFS